MSIYRPQEVRHLKLDSLKQERALFRNWWNEVINQYGIDVEYYRRRTDYVTPDESSAMLYGHNNAAVYDKKSNIRVKVDYNDYNFLLTQEGFIPNDNLTLYFAINDFATSFTEDIGRFQEFPIESSVTGTANVKNGYLRIPFRTKVYSGIALVPVTTSSGTNVEVEDVDEPTSKCMSVAYNPYLHRSFATDYRNGFFSLNIYCDYEMQTSSRARYVLRGGVLYSDFFQDENIVQKVHPNVGDVIEINYHTGGMDVEQYEITEFIQRKPTNSDGISPMLGLVAYKCSAVRRIASHEGQLPMPEEQKKTSDNQQDYAKRRAEAIENEKSWDPERSGKADSSKFYGGYRRPEAFIDDTLGGLSANVDEIFNYDQWKYGWPDCQVTSGNYQICTFSDSSRLYTDGVNLTWELADGTRNDLTSIPASSVHKLGGDIPEMMYVRVEDGQLVYYTADMDMRCQLTRFENPHADDFQYFENFSYKDVGYVNNDGYYIFKNNKIALNSFGNRRLVAFNGYGRTPESSAYVIREIS